MIWGTLYILSVALILVWWCSSRPAWRGFSHERMVDLIRVCESMRRKERHADHDIGSALSGQQEVS